MQKSVGSRRASGPGWREARSRTAFAEASCTTAQRADCPSGAFAAICVRVHVRRLSFTLDENLAETYPRSPSRRLPSTKPLPSVDPDARACTFLRPSTEPPRIPDVLSASCNLVHLQRLSLLHIQSRAPSLRDAHGFPTSMSFMATKASANATPRPTVSSALVRAAAHIPYGLAAPLPDPWLLTRPSKVADARQRIYWTLDDHRAPAF